MEEVRTLTHPQRLNSLGYLINILKTFVKLLKQFVFLFAYIFIQRRDILQSSYLWLIILGFIIIVVIVAYVNFISFKYYIDEEKDEFVVQKGFFSKSKIVIKFSNILQVNITQNVLQKALSLYSLTLDTAGSDKVEVDLYALEGTIASTLKRILLAKINKIVGHNDDLSHNSDTNLIDSTRQRQSLVSLPERNILLFSLFSNYRQGFALFLAFIAYILQHLLEALDTFDTDVDSLEVPQYLSNSLFLILLVLALLLVTIPFVINMVRYFFKYYDFSIVRNEAGTFSMQYGLFKKVNTIFNQDKVQLVLFKQNRLLKRFGIGIVSLKQLVSDLAKADKTSVDIPGITVSDKEIVYNLALGEDIYINQQLLKPRIGLFINMLFKAFLLFSILAVVLIQMDIASMIFYPVLIVGILGAAVYSYFYYISYTLVFSHSHIIKRYGVWNEKELIIPISRTQGVEVSQTFFQRKSSSANLYISTAAKRVSFKFFPQERVNHIVDYMLYFVEK